MRLAPAAALAALTVGFHWKLAFTRDYLWFDSPDMAHIELPRLQFQARALHNGEFPLWIPHSWAGQPLVGQTQPGPLYPFNLLFCALAYRRGALSLPALNWYYIFSRFLAALFCYWCAREFGRSRLASAAAGAAFAFAGFLASCGWLDVANSALWTPLVFLFLHRSLNGRQPLASAASCGFFAGFAFLAGHHEIPVLTFWAAVLFWAAGVAKDRRRLKLLAAFLVIFALAGAAQTLPSLEYARLAVRWTGLELPQGWNEPIPYSVIERYSMPWSALAGMVAPRTGWHDPSVYLGAAAVLMALTGAVAFRSQSGARWMAALAAGSFLFALGANTPFHGWLFHTLPMLGKARVPVRALSLFSFAAAILLAYGLDGLRSVRTPVWLRRAAPCLLFLALVEWWGAQHFPRRGQDGSTGFLDDLFRREDVVAFLRQQPQPVRVMVNDSDIPANLQEWYGFDAAAGVGASVTRNFYIHELHKPAVRRLFAVTHYLGRLPQHPDQKPIFSAADGLQVFRNPGALPRARIVHHVESVPTDAHLRKRLAEETFDMATIALFLGPAPSGLETCEAEESAEITSRTANQVRLKARAACRGLLILAETNFPGWEALIDERSAPIHSAYGIFRSVVLPPGEHEVIFRFRPWSVYLGCLGTAAAAVLTLFVAWFRRPARRCV
jgi:hypothetical protein